MESSLTRLFERRIIVEKEEPKTVMVNVLDMEDESKSYRSVTTFNIERENDKKFSLTYYIVDKEDTEKQLYTTNTYTDFEILFNDKKEAQTYIDKCKYMGFVFTLDEEDEQILEISEIKITKKKGYTSTDIPDINDIPVKYYMEILSDDGFYYWWSDQPSLDITVDRFKSLFEKENLIMSKYSVFKSRKIINDLTYLSYFKYYPTLSEKTSEEISKEDLELISEEKFDQKGNSKKTEPEKQKSENPVKNSEPEAKMSIGSSDYDADQLFDLAVGSLYGENNKFTPEFKDQINDYKDNSWEEFKYSMNDFVEGNLKKILRNIGIDVENLFDQLENNEKLDNFYEKSLKPKWKMLEPEKTSDYDKLLSGLYRIYTNEMQNSDYFDVDKDHSDGYYGYFDHDSYVIENIIKSMSELIERKKFNDGTVNNIYKDIILAGKDKKGIKDSDSMKKFKKFLDWVMDEASYNNIPEPIKKVSKEPKKKVSKEPKIKSKKEIEDISDISDDDIVSDYVEEYGDSVDDYISVYSGVEFREFMDEITDEVMDSAGSFPSSNTTYVKDGAEETEIDNDEMNADYKRMTDRIKFDDELKNKYNIFKKEKTVKNKIKKNKESVNSFFKDYLVRMYFSYLSDEYKDNTKYILKNDEFDDGKEFTDKYMTKDQNIFGENYKTKFYLYNGEDKLIEEFINKIMEELEG